jgi:hypothetical protein
MYVGLRNRRISPMWFGKCKKSIGQAKTAASYPEYANFVRATGRTLL